jgi:D-3-phosphoglycerate dehydrogenase
MSNWKILLTDGLEDTGQAVLRASARLDDRADISADELLDAIAEYDALIVRGRTKVTPQVFTAAHQLKVVGRAGVGVDNINLDAARAQGVAVVNAPTATTLAVAELTLALMFAAARSLARADVSMKAGQWIKKDLKGVELSGKVLGILGMGNIGCAVAQRALALGQQVIWYDVKNSSEEVCGALPVSKAELFERSDFISLHLPLSPETRGMIDSQALALMKPGVRLVCAARGGIIDETALLEALESGHVAAAALDVFAQEPPGLSRLVAHPNVIATPHIGAQTEEAQERAAQDIACEVLAALRGEALRWKVA